MRTRVKAALTVVVLLVAAGGAGLWWFLRDDALPAVSLDTAIESVTESTSAGDADGVDGSWTVDSTSGAFDYESATGTFAGFRVAEELASVGSTTAVGRTGDVSGSMTIDGGTVSEAAFDVDVTTITTNEERRDSKVQEALETAQYPTASFVLTSPIELGDDVANGRDVSVVASGDLTIHGVTKAVDVPIDAQYVDGTIVVVGSLDITFSDFGVEVPRAQIVLSVEDHGAFEFQLLLVRS